ncbi:MAG: pyridoxine 5'-phosphate synthase [Verrucomicrobia bacterium CG_4_10_14_3_um_filter_43_23]|nr:MAG: pyridoxine 5'-phosphate synthase [Verrucomicrobia bacterium CG1_02_43_26]PIP59387.1 MAG: pyridoxine 5'-phosphate synthase [Verrucomicrobia bacterium CG22_combo_CG10-13_8_21_14_all_43_17]PIX58489.1 MAG: pyridoxine 5'-phosphate synthase [Verrucomicrobia bacterium CG_4_10_14_3_um_filter_43_23]PIY62239.1 MAG: pyridoxine 5'-phosphate synthase [Verrucomicrobia bacterium CG_4_10_14_0_8_um_filter_43_34]PJA44297.1 MAG: pyridoxine 5'-phosphate synthase [Verrucomicrobia bacterium CG_4_9_14_3_um_fi
MKLGVNIDHCATLRQARYKDYARTAGHMVEPDPVALATIAEHAGADGITVHLREDRRHIQDEDVHRLKESLQTRMNLEMACTEDMIYAASKIMPEYVCLVPEKRQEVTTEGGLNILAQEHKVLKVVKDLSNMGITVSLFIDPHPEDIKKAADIGAPVVELHTGAFANKYYTPDRQKELNRLIEAAKLAHDLGLIVNAGHGINYVNINDIKQIPHLHELNIGHSIIARALFVGLGEAVREMKALMRA